MIDSTIEVPLFYDEILHQSQQVGFKMPSDKATGALLRALASSKPRSRFLELGTGTGLGACWLLEGMDPDSTLLSVEFDERYHRIAQKSLLHDKRLQLVLEEGLSFLEKLTDDSFDFIYADTWPGKYVGFEHSLRILKKGGIIVLDDMLPQPNWPEDHPPKVEKLLQEIDELPRNIYSVVRQCWYTGHILITKKA
ncbi:MAG: class I SAM-dependent methyltransferase [Verrucomicrobiota bacterium]